MRRTGYILWGMACVLLLVGAGCAKRADVQAPSGSVVGGGVGAPADAARELKQAKTDTMEFVQDTVTLNANGAKMSMNVPKSWEGNGVLFTPKNDKKNHIHIAVYSGSAEQAWEEHQKLDVYQVVSAEKTDRGFLLIANHPTLHATIVKQFIRDEKEPQTYYLIDCLIDYAEHRDESIAACKAVMDSFAVQPPNG